MFTGFFFDQRLLALYSRNATEYDYLRVYAYNATQKNYVQLNIQEANFGRQLFAFENYPAESNKYRMVQVGYLLYDQKQHILTLSRADIDLDAANTPEMIVNHEVEYLSVNDVDRPAQD